MIKKSYNINLTEFEAFGLICALDSAILHQKKFEDKLNCKKILNDIMIKNFEKLSEKIINETLYKE